MADSNAPLSGRVPGFHVVPRVDCVAVEDSVQAIRYHYHLPRQPGASCEKDEKSR